jgi:hypothetical protein
MSAACPWCSYIDCIPYTPTFCQANGAQWGGDYYPLAVFKYATGVRLGS